MDPNNSVSGRAPTCDPSEIELSGRELIAQFKGIEEAWKKAEALLALSHVPTEVRILVRSWSENGDTPHGDERTYLAYCRVKNQWRICVTTETDWLPGQPEDDTTLVDTKPVVECPVDVRLEMFDWFDKLYQEVVKTAEEYVPKIIKAVNRFEKVLASLEK